MTVVRFIFDRACSRPGEAVLPRPLSGMRRAGSINYSAEVTMKKMSLAVLVSLCSLAGVASAQTEGVRVSTDPSVAAAVEAHAQQLQSQTQNKWHSDGMHHDGHHRHGAMKHRHNMKPKASE
jgi:hypothetical protein